MSKTIKMEIEVPAPPEGYGEVEYRSVKLEERDAKFWNGVCWVNVYGFCSTYQYPVARKLPPLWKPPAAWHQMFGDCWLTRDFHSNLHVHKTKPDSFPEYGVWECNDSEFYLLPFRPELLPPDSIPWEQCCFKIGEPNE